MKNSIKRGQKQNLFCILPNVTILFKRTLLFIAITLCLLISEQTHTQRYLPGQKGIQFTGGMADSFKKPGKPESAYYFGTALATYTKNGNRWVHAH